MKLGTIIKQSAIIVTALLFAACAKHPGSANDSDGMSSSGLGSAFGFGSDSAAGESYTNQAPRNQVYLFAYDDASFNEKYTSSVHAQAKYLTSHPGARVLIAGHTDEHGSREYNVALGERRASTVADIIKMDGVPRSQIRVVSYGKERPANLGHDETAHAANRRVELTYEATR